MLNIFERKKKERELEQIILNRLIEQMKTLDSTEERSQAIRLMDQWLDIRKNKPKLSPDTILVVAANLIGILAIINYERVGVVTSKALSFVMRGRV